MNENANILLIDSTPSETYIIGAVLNESDIMDELVGELDSKMFRNPELRELWDAMCRLYDDDEQIEITSLVMLAKDTIERIGTKKLFSIQQTYMGKTQALWHRDKLKECYVRRNILRAITELSISVPDMSINVDALKGDFERALLSLDDVRDASGLQFGTAESVLWLDNLEKRHKDPSIVRGMLTGWSDIDGYTMGWHRQEIVVVGGRTSIGKTAFAIENLIRVYKRKWKAAIFSLEMNKEQVQNRIASNLSKVSLTKIRTGEMTKEEFDKVASYHTVIRDIAIDDMRGITTDYIGAEMKRIKRTRGLDFVVIDYLQEIQEPWQKNDNAGSTLGRITRKLRKFAQECDCGVMALSQLTREADGKEPQNKDLYGSSGIESAADIIVLLHRNKEESPNVLEVNISKYRNGKTGKANLYYDLINQSIDGLKG